MKTCPICNAQVFDDMDVCYGCMYRFDRETLQEKGELPHAKPEELDQGVRENQGKREACIWRTSFELENQAQQNHEPLICVLTVEMKPSNSGANSADSARVPCTPKAAEPALG